MVVSTSDLPEKAPDLTTLARRIEEIAAGRDRVLVALAGPPGSGKSTLAAKLARQIGSSCCVVPMDGFHLDNETLSARGLLHTKGAPETFDLQGFIHLVAALRLGEEDRFPTFDRDADCVIPDGGNVPIDARVLIIEGNYLLFDEPGWVELANEWDASVWIDVPEPVLENRLIQRWIEQGMPRDAARERARRNDMPNALRIQTRALPSTWTVGP
jgi:pantothenate kinase